jgi:hypothetical protein
VLNDCYTVASQDVVFENFGGDLVVLNLTTGRYFGFNPTAATVWQALLAGATPQIIAEVGFRVTALSTFLERLISYELIIPTATAAVPLSDSLRDKLAADLSPPTVEVFDDLADLIVADPIHDADDQQGWPRMAQAS